MPELTAYEPVIGAAALAEIRGLAKAVAGRRMVMVNSTRTGGGVAEILARLVPLLNEVGLPTRWEVLEGSERFYQATKLIHNALHGKPGQLTLSLAKEYLEVVRRNAGQLSLDAELVVIHDPQPLPLIGFRRRGKAAKWIWRCHIDVSQPNRRVWQLIQPFITRYDAAIYSAPAFAQRLPMRQLLIAPSIDPLSEKNRDLTREEIDAVLKRLEIPRDRPIITQVSRFDRLKDPVGVIDTFRRVRKTLRCRLVLVGGPAGDDPEGIQVLAEVREAAGNDPEIHLLMLPNNSDLEINAIQRASAVIVQKSLREGFGLTVSEALWKGRPMVASAVGGIPLQITHGHSGLLVHSVDETASAIRKVLATPGYARRLGENGREHVRHNFLVTRHLADYLLTVLALDHPNRSQIYLTPGGTYAL